MVRAVDVPIGAGVRGRLIYIREAAMQIVGGTSWPARS